MIDVEHYFGTLGDRDGVTQHDLNAWVIENRMLERMDSEIGKMTEWRKIGGRKARCDILFNLELCQEHSLEMVDQWFDGKGGWYSEMFDREFEWIVKHGAPDLYA